MSELAPQRERSTLVVSWHHGHPRSSAIAQSLQAAQLTMPWARAGQPRYLSAVGYLRSAKATWSGVRALEPGGVAVVMCPPVFAAIVALLAAGRSRSVVLDAHSGTFNDPAWRWADPLLQWVLKRVRLVVVTNSAVAEEAGVQPERLVVAHDPLQVRPDGRPSDPPYVVFPASDAFDEPMQELTEAANLLAADGVEVVVTGRVTSISDGPGLRRTGWLSDSDYEDLLSSAVAVLALTTREDTMQRSAYEALERGIPVVASNTRALRTALGPSAVFVTHDPVGLRDGILSALVDRDQLIGAAREVRTRMHRDTNIALDRVRFLAGGSDGNWAQGKVRT